jgi:hypothetical protein
MIPDEDDALQTRSQGIEHLVEEVRPVQGQQGLVATHTGAFPADKDHTGYISSA